MTRTSSTWLATFASVSISGCLFAPTDRYPCSTDADCIALLGHCAAGWCVPLSPPGTEPAGGASSSKGDGSSLGLGASSSHGVSSAGSAVTALSSSAASALSLLSSSGAASTSSQGGGSSAFSRQDSSGASSSAQASSAASGGSTASSAATGSSVSGAASQGSSSVQGSSIGVNITSSTASSALSGTSSSRQSPSSSVVSSSSAGTPDGGPCVDADGGACACPAGTAPGEGGCRSRWVQVSAATRHACAIREDHTAWCWGLGWDGTGARRLNATPEQVTMPPARAVSAGPFNTCALTLEGAMWCWSNGYAFPNGAAALVHGGPWHSVSLGDYHACAINGAGEMHCIGRVADGAVGQLQDVNTFTRVGMEADWDRVSAGMSRTCGLRQGQVWCWGNAVAVPGGANTHVPTQWEAGGHVFTDVDARGQAPCAVDSNGELWCVQGDALLRDSTAATWSRVANGNAHACLLAQGGALWCKGGGMHGEMGTGELYAFGVGALRVMSPLGPWSDVASGDRFSCGILQDTRALHCWGNNNFGQLGVGASGIRHSPRRVGTGTYRSVDMGTASLCAVNMDGQMECSGTNYRGEFGVAAPLWKQVLGTVGLDQVWDSVAVGNGFGCGILATTRQLQCWGSDTAGTQGTGPMVSTTTAPLPVLLPQGAPTMAAMAVASDSNACAIFSDTGQLPGLLLCWGGNNSGEAGVAMPTTVESPVEVAPGQTWKHVALANDHGCAIRADGTAWCWGGNSFSQLGTSMSVMPGQLVQLGTHSDWTSLGLAPGTTCGIRGGAGLSCVGQLPGGGESSSVVAVNTATDWSSVTTWGGTACGINAQGRARCMGPNWAGQLGDGTFLDAAVPVAVAGERALNTVVNAAQGWCALEDGTGALWCWGDNDQGVTGDGEAYRTTPARVVEP